MRGRRIYILLGVKHLFLKGLSGLGGRRKIQKPNYFFGDKTPFFLRKGFNGPGRIFDAGEYKPVFTNEVSGPGGI